MMRWHKGLVYCNGEITGDGLYAVSDFDFEDEPFIRVVNSGPYIESDGESDGAFESDGEPDGAFESDSSSSPADRNQIENQASFQNTLFFNLNDLALEDIKWVDDECGLRDATCHIEGCKVVGLDCEWKPVYEKGEKPKVRRKDKSLKHTKKPASPDEQPN